MMVKAQFLAVLLMFGVSFLVAQERTIAGAENGTTLNVLYRNEASGKVFASTRGLGASFKKSKHVTAKTRSFYEIELQSLRHPKEIRVTGDAPTRKRFVYGKVNTVFLLRGDIGLQNIIFSKADNKAVEVRYSSSIGGSIAFAKPYYVQVVTRYGNTEKAVPFNSDSFTQDSVIGRGTFSEGLAETKIYPGVNAKFNLSFEYAPYTNLVRAIETGIVVDYFPKSLPIMARNPRENIVVSLYIGFVFGQKWF